MVQPVVFKIIKELQKHKKISSHYLSKILKLPEQNIRYHLNELIRNKIIRKEGSKHFLVKTIFNYKGSIIIHLPEEKCFVFENCEYYDECKSKCKKDFNGCRKFNELPKIIRDLIE